MATTAPPAPLATATSGLGSSVTRSGAVDVGAPMTLPEARSVGVGPRAVRRLVRAGMADLLADGRVLLRPDVDVARRAVVGLGSDVVVSLESAAVRYDWPVKTDLLHLSVPRSRTRVRWPNTSIRCRTLTPEDVCTVDGFTTTTPEVTLIDLARWRGLRTTVACLDRALAQQQATARSVRRALAERVRHAGSAVAEQAVSLGCGLRQSPLESGFRCLVFTAGLPAPVDQFEIRIAGTWIGRVDFAWPEAMVLVELDGFEFHNGYAAFQSDRTRDRQMRLAGWLVLRYTAEDIEKRPTLVQEEVRAALEMRGLLA